MKKVLLSVAVILVGIIVGSTFSIAGINKLLKKDGAAPGYTGSPGDSLKNCTACHGGVAYPVEDWLQSDIPADGYEAGKTYTITATNKEFGATRFGFEVSPQAEDGLLLGTIVVTDTLRTKLVGDSKYITYTAEGVEGIDSLTWTFDWVAPTGTSKVTFYAGFNSNYQGHKEDDKTYLSTLTVKEKGTNLENKISNQTFNLQLYPNPVSSILKLNFNLMEKSKVAIVLMDLMGTEINTLNIENANAGKLQKQFNIEHLKNGNYILQANVNGKMLSRNFTVIH